MEKGIQIALRYLENKLTRLINRGVLIKLTQSQNNYSNLHFYCSTLVFNIYFFEFAKLLGGPGPPRPLPTLRHCVKARRKWNHNAVTLVQICFSSQAFMNEERMKESVVEYF